MSTWEYPFMRQAGDLLSEVVGILHNNTVIGVSSLELDTIAESEIRNRGAIPAFLGYMDFPNTICVSVNDEIVHGIPNDRKFERDDVVSVDVGLHYGGYYSDMAYTVILGTDSAAWMLKSATEEALQAGVFAARPGNRIGDIGAAIEAVANKHGVGIVRQYVGHGIGRALHQPPAVPNYGKAGTGPIIKAGMAIAIEPMFTMGSWKTTTDDDGWTVRTADGSLAAHSEHTILITENGPEVLTRG